ncbi:MAG: bifunctional folylpolyglutamate synthase/dihydrofolate synthase [Anaerolineales bacterium]|nr:bifunctional folylpolyglutamate synthase/dihydrofolate synthase [Anaerolineales bacterium]
MLTYDEALDFLYSFVDYGQVRAEKYSPEVFSLARMVGFVRALGDPQRRYPVIHVAGTKGKGSVAALCASALRAGGYRTGFYTSPHLNDFCERVQVNGTYIPRGALAEIVSEFQALAPHHPGVTTFELSTALAFVYFARQNVDVAVMEVGLGGRLDATNVVEPLVSVISSLSFDHTYLLGNTLAEIATEKGGIIKPGVPVVTAAQPPEALAALEQIAAERGAPLESVGRDWHHRALQHSLEMQRYEVWSEEEQRQLNALRAAGHAVAWRPTQLELPLLGRHQVENATLAYAALQAARRAGLPLTAGALAAGFRQVVWPGRFEVLRRAPYVVVDGAHNADSARRLAATVREYFPHQPVRLIFGASSDKDVAGMLAELLAPAVGVIQVILTQAVHPRALEPEALAALARPAGVPVETAASVEAALARALAAAGPEDVVLAAGSLFVVAEVTTAWHELEARRAPRPGGGERVSL